MGILKYLILALVILAIGFFAYIAFTDVEVPQTEVVKDLNAPQSAPAAPAQ